MVAEDWNKIRNEKQKVKIKELLVKSGSVLS